MKVKRILPKVLAAAMSLMILCSGVATASYAAGAESTGASPVAKSSSDAKTSAPETAAKSHNKSYNKEETVYVIADAHGTPGKVIVSDWISNNGNKKLKDKSNLKNIEVVKGDGSFTIDENNACEWDTNGGDIYYRGTGTAELPVGVNIQYLLDGKTVEPKSLAGKSGKLTIRISYSNRKYETVKINGENEKIYVPFVMMTGMMLDNEKCSNVKVSNGKVINDGSHTYVAGFALPGVQESLKLKSSELNIPSSVEITADVKNFELATTLTVAANDVFSDLDVSKLDSKMSDISEELDKLTDATDKLLDGSSQLYDGLSTLLDKSGELIEGVNALKAGAGKLKNGTDTLADGTDSLSSGAAQLDSGVDSLQSGASSLQNGAGSLYSGAAQVNNGADSVVSGAAQLDNGVAQLQGYIATLSGGLDKISSNSDSLKSGAKQVFETLLSTADTQIEAAGLTTDKLTINNYSSVLTALIASLSDEKAQELAYQTALSTVTATVNSQSDMIRQGVENAVRKQVTEGVLAAAGLNMTADQYDAAVAAGQIEAEVQAQVSSAVSTQMTGMQGTVDQKTEEQTAALIESNMKSEEVVAQISEGEAKIVSGRNALESLKTQLDSYNTFYQGILQYIDGVDQASTGAKDILGGTDTLKSGTSSLKNGTEKLKDGIDSLYGGAGQLKSGTDTLGSGTEALKDGSSKLKSGAVALGEGAKTLDNGMGELLNGINTLSSGSGALTEGVAQLENGSMQLNEGMKEFKEQGVDKLKQAADGDIKSLIERIKAMSKASKSYRSYSGISEDAQGKVDFIFKTDGIEK
ncbi:MAG: hypothetical protein U0K87_15955 [Ruminococcus sp.]|nr:hypothetical protein [Ruminococcus sp.]